MATVAQPFTLKLAETPLSIPQFGVFIGMSGKRIDGLVKEGLIPTIAANRIKIGDGARALLAYTRQQRHASTKSVAAQKMQLAKSHEINLRIAEREHRVIDVIEHQDMFVQAFGSLRSTLDSIPARVTRDQYLRKQIETEINDALRRFSEELQAESDRIKETGFETGPDDDE